MTHSKRELHHACFFKIPITVQVGNSYFHLLVNTFHVNKIYKIDEAKLPLLILNDQNKQKQKAFVTYYADISISRVSQDGILPV